MFIRWRNGTEHIFFSSNFFSFQFKLKRSSFTTDSGEEQLTGKQNLRHSMHIWMTCVNCLFIFMKWHEKETLCKLFHLKGKCFDYNVGVFIIFFLLLLLICIFLATICYICLLGLLLLESNNSISFSIFFFSSLIFVRIFKLWRHHYTNCTLEQHFHYIDK